jgi:hypothetical protein
MAVVEHSAATSRIPGNTGMERDLRALGVIAERHNDGGDIVALEAEGHINVRKHTYYRQNESWSCGDHVWMDRDGDCYWYTSDTSRHNAGELARCWI